MEAAASNDYDFPVAKVPLFTKEGLQVSARAIIRTDEQKAISVVSENYEVFEHKKVLELIQPFVNQFGEPQFYATTEKQGARALFNFTFKNNVFILARSRRMIWWL